MEVEEIAGAMVTEVALLVAHCKVTCWPRVMVPALAENETVGRAAGVAGMLADDGVLLLAPLPQLVKASPITKRAMENATRALRDIKQQVPRPTQMQVTVRKLSVFVPDQQEIASWHMRVLEHAEQMRALIEFS